MNATLLSPKTSNIKAYGKINAGFLAIQFIAGGALVRLLFLHLFSKTDKSLILSKSRRAGACSCHNIICVADPILFNSLSSLFSSRRAGVYSCRITDLPCRKTGSWGADLYKISFGFNCSPQGRGLLLPNTELFYHPLTIIKNDFIIKLWNYKNENLTG